MPQVAGTTGAAIPDDLEFEIYRDNTVWVHRQGKERMTLVEYVTGHPPFGQDRPLKGFNKKD